MTIKYDKIFSTKATPQNRPIPGSKQVANSAGGFSFALDDWTRLDRFLVLGSEGGSYYISHRDLTIENASAVMRCIEADGVRVVNRIVEISTSGRAPKNDPAIFALAMCAKLGDDDTRRAAREALPKVCRIGTHLFHFAAYAEAFGGWGRGMRRAVGRWYNDRPADKLAYQLVKYQARDGWSNRDLLRLSHVKPASPAHDALFAWVTKGELPEGSDELDELELVRVVERAKVTTDTRALMDLIREHRLPREVIPTQFLTSPYIWEALLESMPMTAMIRNLANMTRSGLLTQMSDATRTVVDRLRDGGRLAKARIHPLAVLAALTTYQSGRGVRGKNTWTPVRAIVDALDDAFYRTFGNVVPTDKRTLLALDVSGSMTCGAVGGTVGLTPRIASAAMALITAATERDYGFVAFTSTLRELSISPRQRLDDVVKTVSSLPFGGTDCAQPMLWALNKKVDVDTFVVYTDSETWCGSIHPVQALADYRRKTGIPAKLVVVGMVSNGFSIADPDDGGMMDVVGFDTAAPTIISDFARA